MTTSRPSHGVKRQEIDDVGDRMSVDCGKEMAAENWPNEKLIGRVSINPNSVCRERLRVRALS
jgi:hypothetical protein